MEVIGKMKKKIIKLTENDIQRIVKKVINEDFFTRLAARGGGLIAALKARNESKDARQLLRVLGNINSYTNQAYPIILNLKNDLQKLKEGNLLKRALKIEDGKVSSSELKASSEQLESMLTEYQSAIDAMIKIQKEFENFDLTNTTQSSAPTDEPTV